MQAVLVIDIMTDDKYLKHVMKASQVLLPGTSTEKKFGTSLFIRQVPASLKFVHETFSENLSPTVHDVIFPTAQDFPITMQRT